MEIKFRNIKYDLNVLKLQKQAAIIDSADDYDDYSSKLEALDELVELYEELEKMMKDYRRLLEAETVRLAKVSSALQLGDQKASVNFK